MLVNCLDEGRVLSGRAGHLRNLSIPALEASANYCNLCAGLLSILRGHNGIVTYIKELNNFISRKRYAIYDENGITDIDELDNEKK